MDAASPRARTRRWIEFRLPPKYTITLPEGGQVQLPDFREDPPVSQPALSPPAAKIDQAATPSNSNRLRSSRVCSEPQTFTHQIRDQIAPYAHSQRAHTRAISPHSSLSTSGSALAIVPHAFSFALSSPSVSSSARDALTMSPKVTPAKSHVLNRPPCANNQDSLTSFCSLPPTNAAASLPDVLATPSPIHHSLHTNNTNHRVSLSQPVLARSDIPTTPPFACSPQVRRPSFLTAVNEALSNFAGALPSSQASTSRTLSTTSPTSSLFSCSSSDSVLSTPASSAPVRIRLPSFLPSVDANNHPIEWANPVISPNDNPALNARRVSIQPVRTSPRGDVSRACIAPRVVNTELSPSLTSHDQMPSASLHPRPAPLRASFASASGSPKACITLQDPLTRKLVTLNVGQQRVYEAALEGKSVFFTGSAGTGKSVLLRILIEAMRNKYSGDKRAVGVTASTSLAACNIGGSTLHSFSGIGLGRGSLLQLIQNIRGHTQKRARWIDTRTLVIDEISMIAADLFDKLNEIAKTIRGRDELWGGIQLIVTGDFFQLPPFNKESTDRVQYAFDARSWEDSFDVIVNLDVVYRQKEHALIGLLERLRYNNLTDSDLLLLESLQRPLAPPHGVDPVEIYPTRAEVAVANHKRLVGLKQRSFRFLAVDTGRTASLAHLMAPQDLQLAIGSQVMFLRNKEPPLINGRVGIVIGFQKIHSDNAVLPMVRFWDPLQPECSWDVVVGPEVWDVRDASDQVVAQRTQLPLLPAWAISIHKAQGQALDWLCIDLNRVFDDGQVYSALSRATRLEGLQVLNFRRSSVGVNERVLRWMQDMAEGETTDGETTD